MGAEASNSASNIATDSANFEIGHSLSMYDSSRSLGTPIPHCVFEATGSMGLGAFVLDLLIADRNSKNGSEGMQIAKDLVSYEDEGAQ